MPRALRHRWAALASLSALAPLGVSGGANCNCATPDDCGTASRADTMTGYRPEEWIQLAGSLNCGAYCTTQGSDSDEETLDFYAGYQMWTDHINLHPNGTRRSIRDAGLVVGADDAARRYFVNITVCDDQGGLDPEIVRRLYTSFACAKGQSAVDSEFPEFDFLLAPYGSVLTQRAHDAVAGATLSNQQHCDTPFFIAGGSHADDVLQLDLPPIFSPLVPASGFVEPVLATLRYATVQDPEDAVETYAVLSSRGPFETQVADSLRNLLPVSCYNDDKVLSNECIKGCEDNDEQTKFENYCQNATGVPGMNASWLPAPATGQGGCGAWNLGYCGGPRCNGTAPLSRYAVLPNRDPAEGIVYNSTYIPQKHITGNIYNDLSNIFARCRDSGTRTDTDDCKLDALIAVGHSREFQQYVRVFGNFIRDGNGKDLPKYAVFVDGLRPTEAMVSKNDTAVFPYNGWLGTTSWHEAMGRDSTASDDLLGNSSFFQAQIRKTLEKYQLPRAKLGIPRVTSYHAQAAASCLLLQLALRKLDSAVCSDTLAVCRHKEKTTFDQPVMRTAFHSVNASTFFGDITLDPSGLLPGNQRTNCTFGVLQIQEYGAEPVLVGPPELLPTGAPSKVQRTYGDPPRPPSPAAGCALRPTEGDNVLSQLLSGPNWRRDPTCFVWTQQGICLTLAIAAVLVVYRCLTKDKRRGKQATQAVSAGLNESLMGSMTASELLPNTDSIISRWTPRGSTASAEPEHEMDEIGAPSEGGGGDRSSQGSLGSRGSRLSRQFSSRTTPKPTSPEGDARPPRMFQNEDTKDLKDLQKIGQGSFGVVYSGRWKGGGEGGRDVRVAMKELEMSATEETPMAGELMRDLLKDFKKEVAILVGLNHPHVVKFYGYATEDPKEAGKGKSRIIRPRIILELMEGGALDHLLYTEKWKPTVEQVLKMSMDVVEAMIYLHNGVGGGKPIIHRDLKSPNLLLVRFPSEEGEKCEFVPEVKITDFGLAREKDERDSLAVGNLRESIADGNAAMRQTQIMTGCGTLYWMAPEVLKGDVYNESVDVYAFAMCLLEMISGEVPWRGIPAQEVPYKVAMEEKRPDFPLELTQTSPNTCKYVLRELIKQCWDQDSKARPRFDGDDGIMKRLQYCMKTDDSGSRIMQDA